MNECTLCPRECRVDRSAARGYCGAPAEIVTAKAYLHQWEEPCISGSRGSGCIFFSHCQLRCCFCQNYSLSRGKLGRRITPARLCEIMLRLQQDGAHNINLVSPTPYIPQIIEALQAADGALKIPVAVNSGGYERVQTLRTLRGYADIYMTDIKLYSAAAAAKYLAAPDYFDAAIAALDEMLEQTGEPTLSRRGLLQRGVIVRCLVMPSLRHDAMEILKRLHARYGSKRFLLSLMSQYTPAGEAAQHPEINRRVTSLEYNSVAQLAGELGFRGYTQQRSSASSSFIPDFDLQGI